MINLDVHVLTHPARAGRIPPLLAALNTEVCVTVDAGKGYWGTARDIWQQADTQATHVLVLQDDIVPCLDLILGVRMALEHRPSDVISLFSASTKIGYANAQGYAWAIGRSLSWSQGIVLPREMIGPWLEFVEKHCRPDIRSHDARLSAFLLIADIPVLYTVPCLVEHDAPNDSLIGNNRGDVIRRVAGYFPGESWSALSQDWTAGAEYPFPITTPGKRAYNGILKSDSPFASEFGRA